MSTRLKVSRSAAVKTFGQAPSQYDKGLYNYGPALAVAAITVHCAGQSQIGRKDYRLNFLTTRMLWPMQSVNDCPSRWLQL